MARYEIEFNDDTVIEADDARFACDGRFVELIPRKPTVTEGAPERLLLNISLIRSIHHKPIGYKGGWRFSGDKDAYFEPTEGSI